MACISYEAVAMTRLRRRLAAIFGYLHRMALPPLDRAILDGLERAQIAALEGRVQLESECG